jgi:hypothetical protein
MVLFIIDCFDFNPTKGSHMVRFVQAEKGPNIVVISFLSLFLNADDSNVLTK